MQKRRRWDGVKVLLLVAVAVLGSANPAFAEVSSSNNYQVTETQFNSGASLNTCSAGYCAQVAIGSAGSGNASGSTTGASFGDVTPDRPTLSVIVIDGASTLGQLTPETTGAKTLQVKVKSYLSDGYVLQINGRAPHYSTYTLQTPITPTVSTPGTEQFGINVVANTTPNIGANPVQVPDGDTSFGVVKNDYNQANKFMYIDGDPVASSTVASGQTDYTVSMIVNISNRTPAGTFGGEYSAVVVPLY